MEEKPVNIGFVGGGFMGQLAHIANYREIKGCRVAALAELRPLLREKVAQRYDIPKTYATHDEMLQNPELDAIVVVTTRPMLGPIALDCLRAGKHVLTEKPMAGNAKLAENLVSAAAQNNVQYIVGYMKRHDDGVKKVLAKLSQLRDSGELGQIVYARVHNFMGDTYCNIDGCGNIKTNEETPARIEWSMAPSWLPESMHQRYAWFMNAYCHDINLMRYLLASPKGVCSAHLKNINGQTIMFDYDNFACVLEAGQFGHSGWDEVVEIFFEHGKLRLSLPAPMLRNIPAQVTVFDSRVNEERHLHADWSWSFRRQAEDFVHTIQTGKTSRATGVDSVEDLYLMEKIWRLQFERGESFIAKGSNSSQSN